MAITITTHQNHTYTVLSCEVEGSITPAGDPDFMDHATYAVYSGVFHARMHGGNGRIIVPGRDVRQVTMVNRPTTSSAG